MRSAAVIEYAVNTSIGPADSAASNDLEMALQLATGDGAVELALFPDPPVAIALDEGRAEEGLSRL
jgi:hypothetical protein